MKPMLRTQRQRHDAQTDGRDASSEKRLKRRLEKQTSQTRKRVALSGKVGKELSTRPARLSESGCESRLRRPTLGERRSVVLAVLSGSQRWLRAMMTLTDETVVMKKTADIPRTRTQADLTTRSAVIPSDQRALIDLASTVINPIAHLPTAVLPQHNTQILVMLSPELHNRT